MLNDSGIFNVTGLIVKLPFVIVTIVQFVIIIIEANSW